jgi:hypothetical protein
MRQTASNFLDVVVDQLGHPVDMLERLCFRDLAGRSAGHRQDQRPRKRRQKA